MVLPIDREAPGPMLRLAQTLVQGQRVAPERIVLLVMDDGEDASDLGARLGLPDANVLVESDPQRAVRRLVAALHVRTERPAVAA